MDLPTAKGLLLQAVRDLPKGTLAPDLMDDPILPEEAWDLFWGCHEVIEAPDEALNWAALESGMTYHDAALHRAMNMVYEVVQDAIDIGGGLEDLEDEDDVNAIAAGHVLRTDTQRAADRQQQAWAALEAFRRVFVKDQQARGNSALDQATFEDWLANWGIEAESLRLGLHREAQEFHDAVADAREAFELGDNGLRFRSEIPPDDR
jgi:hypothetical protein